MTGVASDESPSAVRVRSLVGRSLAEVTPVPETAAALKVALEEKLGIPRALQKLVRSGDSTEILGDDALLDASGLDVVMVVDETAMYSWDWEGNPDKDQLQIEGSVVTCPQLRTDYINVLTKEPIRCGTHYFEFHMHSIGDEQWCGIMQDPQQAGRRCSGRYLHAWAYYAGRMNCKWTSLTDGEGALHAERRAVAKFQKLRPSGDVIGMLVDMDRLAVAFDLNGTLQGACAIPGGCPFWVFTHVDTTDDHVELRKPSLLDAPPENLSALSGALLEIKGEFLSYWGSDPFAEAEVDSGLTQDED